MKRYKLLKSDTISVNGITLYRIKALKDFGNVKKGDLGGYIESKINLSQEGKRVSDNARVFDEARVFGNAWVYGNARVSGNAWVYGNARVYGEARVSGNARVYGNAWVYGNAQVSDNAWVYGNAEVFENAEVFGKARVFGEAEVTTECLNIYNYELFRYNITFTDYHISIGCIQMLASEWLEVGIEDAGKMGLNREYYLGLQTLVPLIKYYYLKPLN